jgi:hypothetical protein
VLAIAVALMAGSAPVYAASGSGGDPLGGFSDAVQTNGSNWVALMMAIAAIVVAGAIYYGSQNAMKWVGRFIAGTFFALLATMGPQGVLEFLSGLFRFGGGSR